MTPQSRHHWRTRRPSKLAHRRAIPRLLNRQLESPAAAKLAGQLFVPLVIVLLISAGLLSTAAEGPPSMIGVHRWLERGAPEVVAASLEAERPRLIPLAAAESGYSENSSVNLLCTVSQGHHEMLAFDWFKDGQPLGQSTGPGEQVVALIERQSDHSLLRIPRVQARHSGRYTCTTKNPFGQDSSSVNLLVNVKLQWVQEPVAEVSVSLNQELRLDCLADGEPKPSIRWEKLTSGAPNSTSIWSRHRVALGGEDSASKRQLAAAGAANGYKLALGQQYHHQQQPLMVGSQQMSSPVAGGSSQPPLPPPPSSSSTTTSSMIQNSQLVSSNRYLNVRRVKESDGGIYECIASNSHDPDLRKLVVVKVRAPASFEQRFAVVQARLADPVQLECNATGDTPIKLDWFRESNGSASLEKHGNELYDIHELARPLSGGGHLLASLMQLRSAKASDGGLYKCLASNEFGSAERLVKLIVLAAPARPVQLRARDVWSRSVMVTWSSATPSSPAARPTNYTVQYWRRSEANHRREELLVDGLASSALLSNLSPALTYEVSVIARNSVGQSEPSELVSVTTGEEEPAAPPTDVQVEPRGASTLRLTWKAPPGESLNGRLLGFYVGYRPRQVAAGAALESGLALDSADPFAGQQQQLQHQLRAAQVFSFKTAEALEGQAHYDTFVANLRPLTEYELSVRAFNKAGSGPDSHLLVARTGSARLPQAPQLQAQRLAGGQAAQLRWSSTGGLSSEPLRHVLFLQLQGERDWAELPLGSGASGDASGGASLASGGPAPALAADPLTAHTGHYTLASLQPGHAYRLYVAAVNEFGLGDPSNVVLLRAEPPSAGEAAQTLEAAPGSALLLGELATGAPSSAASLLTLDWLLGGPHQHPHQQHQQPAWGLVGASTGLLLVLVGLLVGVWHFRRRRATCSSSGASSSGAGSYPTSWTAAAGCETLQSQYSIQQQHHLQQCGAGLKAQQPRPPPPPLPAPASGAPHLDAFDSTSSRSSSREARAAQLARDHQLCHQKALLRNLSQQRASAAPAAPAAPAAGRQVPLSSHYHQPSDSLLHLSAAGRRSSATLSRAQGQARQLPPIPYSTLSVREMNASAAARQQHRPQQHYQANNKSHSTGGSQAPLIYGVID